MFWSSLVHLRDVGKIYANVLGLEKKRYGQASWWCLLFDTMLCTKQFLSHFGAAASKGKKEFEKEKEKQKKKTKMRGHIYVCIECVIPINPFSPDWEIGLATNLICIFSLVGLKLTEYCHVTHLYILYIALST